MAKLKLKLVPTYGKRALEIGNITAYEQCATIRIQFHKLMGLSIPLTKKQKEHIRTMLLNTEFLV